MTIHNQNRDLDRELEETAAELENVRIILRCNINNFLNYEYDELWYKSLLEAQGHLGMAKSLLERRLKNK